MESFFQYLQASYPLKIKFFSITKELRELRHWPSIAGMSSQSHCGGEEDGHIGLSS